MLIYNGGCNNKIECILWNILVNCDCKMICLFLSKDKWKMKYILCIMVVII